MSEKFRAGKLNSEGNEFVKNPGVNETNIEVTNSTINKVDTTDSKIFIDALPSGSLIFDDSTQIFYTPYKFKDLKHINSSNYFDSEGNIDHLKLVELLKLSLSYLGIINGNIEDLPWIDYEYIELYRKVNTIGNVEDALSLSWRCSKCKTQHTTSFKFSDIKFPTIDSQLTKLPVTITLNDGSNLSMTLLNVKREIELHKYYSELKDKDSDIVAIAQLVKNNKTLVENVELIENISNPEDLRLIDYASRLLNIKNKSIEVICKKCIDGNPTNWTIDFPSISEFIVPEDPDKEFISSRIKFG